MLFSNRRQIQDLENAVRELEDGWALRENKLNDQLERFFRAHMDRLNSLENPPATAPQQSDLARTVVERMYELLLVQAGHPDLAKTFGVMSRQSSDSVGRGIVPPAPNPADEIGQGVTYA